MNSRVPVLVAFLLGAVFSCGLVLSGMTSPDNILGFLDVAGEWNPQLAFVMMGALSTYALLRTLTMRRRARPVLTPIFEVPSQKQVDGPLVLGAAIFGVGWGLSGYCPGPSFTALGTATLGPLIFVSAMFAGMAAHQYFLGHRSTALAPGPCE